MFQNWSRSVECPDTPVLLPESSKELNGIIRGADGSKPIRVVGGGHSFVPLVSTDGIIISLDRLQGILDIDQSARTARIKAGTRLSTIGNALAAKDLAMENLGDINVQSLAGATSTGTHGTGMGLGNIATQIAALKFLRADGEELTASPSENSDVFAGGRIGLGSLGVLTEITLNLVPSFRLKLERDKMDLDDCLDRSDELISRNRSFEFYWLPHTSSVLAKAWRVTSEPAEPPSWRRYATETILENATFGALCKLGKVKPSLCPPISRFCASMIGSDSHVGESHSMLATVRNVRFHEMEWSVPAEKGAEVMREVREFIARKEFPLMFPLEYRWVRGDDIWLSPNYGRDSVHISFHQFIGMPFERYFDGIQAICLNHGGRPHWGKMHSLTGESFRSLYPRWDEFLALREKMDPKGLFLTPYMRKLFGLEFAGSVQGKRLDSVQSEESVTALMRADRAHRLN